MQGPNQGPRDLPGWADDHVIEVMPALRRSCAAWRVMPPDQLLGGEGLGSRAGDWIAACAALATLPPRPAGAARSRRVVAWLARMREYFEHGFTIGEIGTGTMTGYYEPTLRGDLVPSDIFATPLHSVPPRDWSRRRPPPTAVATAEPVAAEAPPGAVPDPLPEAGPVEAPGGALADSQQADAVSVPAPTVNAVADPLPSPRTQPATTGRRTVTRSVPAIVPRGPGFPSRAEIEEGALDGQGLELVWVDSAVDAFFLHIQGSGRVVLPDGRLLRFGYAAQNGHPYRGIGRTLIERGELRRDELSMQSIRGWLASARAEAAQGLMRINASYIFFRLVEGLRREDGPIGAMGVPLTPLRSVAVDPAFVPMGAPLFLAGTAPLPRLVVAQDTGGAIRGAGRADMFWGWSEEAGQRAGGTFQPARMFLLRPRPVF